MHGGHNKITSSDKQLCTVGLPSLHVLFHFYNIVQNPSICNLYTQHDNLLSLVYLGAVRWVKRSLLFYMTQNGP